jgi:ABC-2 type transport system permease protein
MTAATQPVALSTPHFPSPTTPQLISATLRSEFIKLRSVRSTMWSLLATVVLTVGLGALICVARASRADHLDPRDLNGFDPTSFSLAGLLFAQLAIGVLGVLVISSEYSTGQIRATFGATPQRRLVLTAKVVVFMAVVFVVGLVTCLGAFFIGQSILSSKFQQASIGDPGVLRAIIGGAAFLAVIGALGVGLGSLLRRTAGAIAVFVVLLLIVPIFVNFLPSPWNDDIAKYLPLRAGPEIYRAAAPSSGDLSLWAAFAVFCGYAVVSLALGGFLLTRRDA